MSLDEVSLKLGGFSVTSHGQGGVSLKQMNVSAIGFKFSERSCRLGNVSLIAKVSAKVVSSSKGLTDQAGSPRLK